MQKKSLKRICVLLSLVMVALVLTSCDISTGEETPEPVAVTLKTDLHDAMFTFTYGELESVLPTELLSTLFEDYEEKNADTTIELNYNDLKARYAGNDDKELFSKVLALLSAEEQAQLNGNRVEALEYYTRIANAIKTQKPATVYSENFWVIDSTIQFTDEQGNVSDANTPLSKSARLYKDMISSGISDALPRNVEVKAGTDLNDILYLKGSNIVSELTLDDIDVIYTSVTPTTENNSAEEPVVTELTRIVEIHLKDNPDSIKRAITFRNPTEVLAKLTRAENSFTVSEYTLVPHDCVIIATFNAATDELLSLSYDKNMTITAVVTGEGSLASYGTQTLTFESGSNMYYQFGWESEAK
ncbi:MAG: hypothetical protein ACI4K9_01885 [Candidatus Fimenecus sp.]